MITWFNEPNHGSFVRIENDKKIKLNFQLQDFGIIYTHSLVVIKSTTEINFNYLLLLLEIC